MKRRKWTKEERKRIYQKYKGHCAYCGCKIRIEEMQVDHIVALKRGGADSIENANPACRMCNKYKDTLTLYDFKNWLLAGVISRLQKLFIFRIAERYGMITVNKWDKKFYFERIKK